jgi:hypothetical protein
VLGKPSKSALTHVKVNGAGNYGCRSIDSSFALHMVGSGSKPSHIQPMDNSRKDSVCGGGGREYGVACMMSAGRQMLSSSMHQAVVRLVVLQTTDCSQPSAWAAGGHAVA